MRGCIEKAPRYKSYPAKTTTDLANLTPPQLYARPATHQGDAGFFVPEASLLATPRRLCAPPARPSVELLLDREVAALDALMSELRAGVRSQAHYHDIEERGLAIAARIRIAFRGTR